jgi:hypothetical protein
MMTISFTGWNVGMRGIPFIHLLHDNANISLQKAKDIKDSIVNGEHIQLEIENADTARYIISEAERYGIICEG